MKGAKPILVALLLQVYSISAQQGQCEHDRLYSVQGDCTRFRRCDEGFLRHPESCGAGTAFSEQNQICLHFNEINSPDCVQQREVGPFDQFSQLCQNPPPGVDPSQAWNVPHPQYCNGFIVCGNGRAIPSCQLCPQDTIFPDYEFRVCRPGKQKNCSPGRTIVPFQDYVRVRAFEENCRAPGPVVPIGGGFTGNTGFGGNTGGNPGFGGNTGGNPGFGGNTGGNPGYGGNTGGNTGYGGNTGGNTGYGGNTGSTGSTGGYGGSTGHGGNTGGPSWQNGGNGGNTGSSGGRTSGGGSSWQTGGRTGGGSSWQTGGTGGRTGGSSWQTGSTGGRTGGSSWQTGGGTGGRQTGGGSSWQTGGGTGGRQTGGGSSWQTGGGTGGRQTGGGSSWQTGGGTGGRQTGGGSSWQTGGGTGGGSSWQTGGAGRQTGGGYGGGRQTGGGGLGGGGIHQFQGLCQNPPPGYNYSVPWNVAHPNYCNGFIRCANGSALLPCEICATGTYFPENTFAVCRETPKKNNFQRLCGSRRMLTPLEVDPVRSQAPDCNPAGALALQRAGRPSKVPGGGGRGGGGRGGGGRGGGGSTGGGGGGGWQQEQWGREW